MGPVVDIGAIRRPAAGPDARLRWDLAATHATLEEGRRDRQLTLVGLAEELDCTPNRLTHLRTARRPTSARCCTWCVAPTVERKTVGTGTGVASPAVTASARGILGPGTSTCCSPLPQ